MGMTGLFDVLFARVLKCKKMKTMFFFSHDFVQ